MALSFTVNGPDSDLIARIADRAFALDRQNNGRHASKLMDWRMDITATHASGNPLRLAELADADDFNFAHDVFGISRHLDRATGELTGFFSPRFSARVSA